MSDGSPIDYLDPDVPLADVVLHLSGRLDEMRQDLDYQGEVATRFDEGVAAMQWIVSRLATFGSSAYPVPVGAVLGMLDELVIYANVGEARTPEWLEKAREQIGRAG